MSIARDTGKESKRLLWMNDGALDYHTGKSILKLLQDTAGTEDDGDSDHNIRQLRQWQDG